jgi:transcription initiation factor TFIIIB Brf1 subunit/transcription initiation factor TFIIB
MQQQLAHEHEVVVCARTNERVCVSCGLVVESSTAASFDIYAAPPASSAETHPAVRQRAREVLAAMRLPDAWTDEVTAVVDHIRRRTVVVVAAAVYIVALRHGVPRTEREIASANNVSRPLLRRHTAALRGREHVRIAPTPPGVAGIVARRLGVSSSSSAAVAAVDAFFERWTSWTGSIDTLIERVTLTSSCSRRVQRTIGRQGSPS